MKAIAVVCGVVMFAAVGAAQRAAPPATSLETLPVQGAVHVIAGAGANVVVQIGPLGAVVVDAGPLNRSADVLAAIRALTRGPIRFIINTHAHDDHVGANERLAASGEGIGNRAVTTVGSGEVGRPEIVAHELVLTRMSATGSGVPVGAWPTTTFSSDEKVLFVNGEGLQIVHIPMAHTDGDSLVFFRRSDVIATGDLYSTETYPVIDLARGGTITGVLAGLNRLLALAIAGEKVEGGTMIVPGHGRISDEADLVEYRDMVTIVRDRVKDMVARKLTLAQVQAARPTLDYDPEYGGTGDSSAERFVESVFRSLSK